jgi:hypothetical protein
MDDSQVGLQAAIRALSDVVAPAVDPQHAQAGDQLRLTIDYLRFLAQRMDHLRTRDRYELGQHLQTAGALQPLAQSARLKAAAGLAASAAHADRLLSSAEASAESLRAGRAQLAAALCEVVRESAGCEPSTRRQIEQQVLRSSQDRVAFERAWYLPLQLDPDAHDTQPLSAFLAGP